MKGQPATPGKMERPGGRRTDVVSFDLGSACCHLLGGISSPAAPTNCCRVCNDFYHLSSLWSTARAIEVKRGSDLLKSAEVASSMARTKYGSFHSQAMQTSLLFIQWFPSLPPPQGD
ncbi:hypothetical protein VULLAG_LOCUS12704 [Vulpes lagopus]